MTYRCCDETRRAAVAIQGKLNGIDWLEVLDSDAPEGLAADPHLRQRTLMLRLLKRVPNMLAEDNVRIVGGDRVRDVGVTWVAAADRLPAGKVSRAERDFFGALKDPGHVLLVRTDRAGDFSVYQLRLVKTPQDGSPPDHFDPRLVEVDFRFKAECTSDFDCKPATVCPDEGRKPPDIDYLAKDYEGFRRLILDRLSQLVPGWRERSAADLGVALAEVLAYVADQLSYWQDAVATEAYLETARRRTSLRRHALLVDYAVHEGCNARAWVQVRVNADGVRLAKGGARFLTRVPTSPKRIVPGSRQETEALRENPLVFEPMHGAVLYSAHNSMSFYSWGDSRCCLPKGATSATLSDDRASRLRLRPGDVLIFEERVGPLSGRRDDANPQRRHAVRLTRVRPEAAPVLDAEGDEVDRVPGVLCLDPLTKGTGAERAIVEVEWGRSDALPFPFCVSSVTDEAHGRLPVADVSVALGNIVLTDHGATIENESLGAVPRSSLYYAPERDASHCEAREPVPVPPRYQPRLAEGPLTRTGTVLKTVVGEDGIATTRAVPFDPDTPASAPMSWDTAGVVPDIELQSAQAGRIERWEPRRDLLDSEETDNHFVVEAEHDGTSRLRFGDAAHGRRPASGMAFAASYRVGNGIAGNVGTEAIAHVVSDDGRIISVTNPLPAAGGTDPETTEQVRRRAPQAFRTQERAVTAEDYAEVTERLPDVQRAAASLRWTGSWHTVFVTVDREEGVPVDPAYADTVLGHLEGCRMAGHDLDVRNPEYVSLEIDLMVCVAPDGFRSEVREALLKVLGTGTLRDGRHGVFHPDNFTFGQTVYLSPLYAAARRVPGVASLEITKFQRLGRDDPKPLVDGFLTLGPLQIARLDNDPNYPEHGVLRLDLHGGK